MHKKLGIKPFGRQEEEEEALSQSSNSIRFRGYTGKAKKRETRNKFDNQIYRLEKKIIGYLCFRAIDYVQSNGCGSYTILLYISLPKISNLFS
jgi:hypothetical protein